MKRLDFKGIYDLAEIMDSYVSTSSPKNEYPVISAYGDYEIAKALIEELISVGNPIGAILELEDYEMSHYDKEFVVYLSDDGVSCEKVWRENIYYYGGGDISFVHEDCNSKLLDYIDSETVYEFGVDVDDEEFDFDKSDEIQTDKDTLVHYSEDEDGDMHGFSVSKSDDNGYRSYSFYTSESLDKNDIQKILKNMGF